MRQHAGTTTKILCLTAVVRSWGFRLKKVLLRCELSRNLRISVTQPENVSRHFVADGTVIA